MTVLAYTRISKSESNGESLANQKAQVEEYCRMAKLGEVEHFCDNGVSGTMPIAERPQGKRFVRRIEAGDAEHIIATKPDRLFRSLKDAYTQMEDWNQRGIGIHIINMGGQTLNTGSAVGKLFFNILAAFAEFERDMISERTKEVLRHKRNVEGKWVGRVPFGYQIAADGKLEENAKEQGTLWEILAAREAGVSMAKIAMNFGISVGLVHKLCSRG